MILYEYIVIFGVAFNLVFRSIGWHGRGVYLGDFTESRRSFIGGWIAITILLRSSIMSPRRQIIINIGSGCRPSAICVLI